MAQKTLTRGRRDFSVDLSTGRWVFVQTPLQGVTLSNKAVVIPPCPESRDRLDTDVHETLHTSVPELSEAEVTRIAGDISRVLWRMGYRMRPPATTRSRPVA